MTKQELFDLLKEIAEYYPMFIDVTDEDAMKNRARVWYRALEKFEIESVRDALADFATKSEYAPKIADLVKNNSLDRQDNIPDVETTKSILDEKYAPVPKEKQLTKEQINEMLIQTIGRGLKNL
jgi:hypothetical protein